MRRTQKNMFAAIMAQIITIITGFLVQRYVLLTFGSEYNGLTSAVTQILQYLVLLEAGLTTASIQALYKPITENDYKTMSGILSATRLKFLKVGSLFFFFLLVTSFILPIVVGDEINYGLALVITIVSGAGTGLTYMFINKYQALFYADNKTGIVYNLTSITNILICVLKIALMQLGFGIVYVQSMNLVGVLFRLFCIWLIFKQQYTQINMKDTPRYDLINKSNNVLVHQIAGFVNNNTDVLLITAFASLKSVSLYSVYNMVYVHINSLLQSVFAQAPLGYFGQTFAKSEKKFKQLFDTFELFYTYTMFVILTVVMELILAFVGLYTKGVNDINYIDPILAWLFFSSQVLNLIRIPSIITINVSGDFKETQKGAMVEAIVNLSVSIPMFFLIGVHGLLVGTIVAMMFRSIDITRYVYKNIRSKSLLSFFMKLISHFFIAFISIISITPMVMKFANSWTRWIISGILSFTVTALIFLIFEVIFFKKEMKQVVGLMKKISIK